MLHKEVTMWIVTEDDEYEETVLLPAEYVVCSRCEGTGKHTNPNIDGNGISPEQFAEDPDFAEDYFSGVYDVRCEECRGNRVILEVAEDDIPKEHREAWESHKHSMHEQAQEKAWEERNRRLGIQY